MQQLQMGQLVAIYIFFYFDLKILFHGEKEMYVALTVNICNIDIIFIVITEILNEHRTFLLPWLFVTLDHIRNTKLLYLFSHMQSKAENLLIN